jgi:SPP1 family predicted phage head-tail adaptor
MVSCKKITTGKNSVCIGDLDQKIKIQTTTTTGNNSPGTYSTIEFQDIVAMWALIKTTKVNRFIDNVNTADGITTDFYIRYTADIDLTIQLWIEWRDIKFKVISSNNMDKQYDFIHLRAVEHGDKNVNANLR